MVVVDPPPGKFQNYFYIRKDSYETLDQKWTDYLAALDAKGLSREPG